MRENDSKQNRHERELVKKNKNKRIIMTKLFFGAGRAMTYASASGKGSGARDAPTAKLRAFLKLRDQLVCV